MVPPCSECPGPTPSSHLHFPFPFTSVSKPCQFCPQNTPCVYSLLSSELKPSYEPPPPPACRTAAVIGASLLPCGSVAASPSVTSIHLSLHLLPPSTCLCHSVFVLSLCSSVSLSLPLLSSSLSLSVWVPVCLCLSVFLCLSVSVSFSLSTRAWACRIAVAGV